MKASDYNVFFIHDGYQIGYNANSNQYIMLDPLLHELYQTGWRRNDFSELGDIHPEFYEYLVANGFLVDEKIDEFEQIKNRSQEIDNDDSVFHLIVNPTMNCNFKCWYCYESHIKDSKMTEATIESVIKLCKNVISQQKNLKKFILSFFGGEPLLYFDKVIKKILMSVSALCKEKDIVFSAGMTTNGLLINPTMLETCKTYGLNGFQITLDGSRERHDKVRFISDGRGSYDKIVENIILTVKMGLNVLVRINCSSETMHRIDEIMSEFKDLTSDDRRYIQFDFQKVWQEVENINEQIFDSKSMFQERGYIVSGHTGGSVLNSCYGDKRYQATINYNGEVFKCTARDFVNNSGEGMLNSEGTIIWNDKYEKRLSSKFKNAPCKKCRILPLCGGGCSQQALENEGVDYCVMGYDEEAKTRMVMNKFKELVDN